MTELLSIEMLAWILGAYLLGSIPTAVWVGKWFYNLDVREHGSGNAGATNTFRVLGKKAGIPVLLFDILKGWTPVALAGFFSAFDQGSNAYVNMQLLVGLGAVLGHIFPLYARFKGGKGIATLLGIIIAVHPPAAFACLGVFVFAFLLSKIVSVGSMLAAVSFPIFISLIFHTDSTSLIYFSMFVAVAVLITHKKNIMRLLRNEENKMQLNAKIRRK